MQANNFILDISKSNLSINEIMNQIKKIYKDPKRRWINIIILKKGKNLIKIFKRN